MGSVSLIIFARQFIHWCTYQSQIIKFWRNATDFLGVKGTRSEVDWGKLPSDLWVDIGKHVTSRLDILRFRSVCKEWRSSLPYPTRFPLRVPPPPSCDPEFRNVPHFITEVSVYMKWADDQCCTLWVTFEELINQPSKFRTWITIPEEDKFTWPTISSMAEPPLSHFSFIMKAYRLRIATLKDNVEGQWAFPKHKFVIKTVLISSDATRVNPRYASDLTVVAHYRRGKMKGRLAMLRLQGPPEDWVWDTDFCNRVYVAIAAYKGQLCTVDKWGRVFFMDYNSLRMTQVCDSSSIVYEMEGKDLFEASGNLYLADFSSGNSEDIKMYKLSLRLQKWLKVENMGRDGSDPGPFPVPVDQKTTRGL